MIFTTSLRKFYVPIIVFSSLLICTPVLAHEIYKTSSVLIGWENSGLSSDNFIVRQEKYRVGSILVSRPVPVDILILDFIRVNNITSIENYAHWLAKNIEYKKDDDADTWSSPNEMLGRRYGDCEDYAFLNASVLRMFGYKPKVLALGRLGKGHAICVFEKDGQYNFFDNSKLKKTNTSSITELAKYIFTDYFCTYLLELDFETKKWNILFKRHDML